MSNSRRDQQDTVQAGSSPEQPEVVIDSGVGNQGFDYQDLIKRLNKRIQQNDELSDNIKKRFHTTGSFLDVRFTHMITATRKLNNDSDRARNWIKKLQTGEQDPKKSSELRDKATTYLADLSLYQTAKKMFIAGLTKVKSKLMSKRSQSEPKPDEKPPTPKL